MESTAASEPRKDVRICQSRKLRHDSVYDGRWRGWRVRGQGHGFCDGCLGTLRFCPAGQDAVFLGARHSKVPPSARPLPSWMARACFMLISFFGFFTALGGAFVIPREAGRLSAVWLSLFLILLSCGGLFLACTPGPTFLGLPKGKTRSKLLGLRLAAILVAGTGLILSIRWLLRLL